MLTLAAAAATATAIALLALAPVASAHGPINPAGSSYLARVRETPPGVDAKVVDGDLRLWLDVAPGRTLIVLDYRGAPYLRFTSSGVYVNHNSSMYYLNQVPPELVPAADGPHTPPRWEQVSSGHSYEWHDGRLGALAATVLAPGTRYVGRWSIAARYDGRPAVIGGGLSYAPDPSIVWFWPVVVALACVLAGLRMRSAELDLRLARALALACLVALTIAGLAEQLHGRPNVSVGQVLVLVVLLAFVSWGVRGLVLGRHGWFSFFLIALAAVFEGATLIGVLLHGFVLIALPPLVARLAVSACLAAGCALLPVIFRLAEQPGSETAPDGARPDDIAWDNEASWEWDA